MKVEIIIVGAGAAGLMAARELARAGKRVLILEARDRIGGRILSVKDDIFGYPAQGGAEWVHGAAPITKALVKEAGLTLVPEGGEVWSLRNGVLEEVQAFALFHEKLKEKLKALTEDISIAEFLEKNFSVERDRIFNNSILKMVEGYDAADPKLVSTFMLRDEWLGVQDVVELGSDHRIKEGYGALMNFLKNECEKLGVAITCNTWVNRISVLKSGVKVNATDFEYTADICIVTVPVPIIKEIDFGPELKWKHEAASKIGFGHVTKVLIKFTDRWWEHAFPERDLTNMAFMLSNEKFLTWWTQYPEINTVLTGWMAGPTALEYKDKTDKEIFDEAMSSLSRMFNVNKEELKKKVVVSEVFNWQADPCAKGAYSYTTYKTGNAYEKLLEQIQNKLYFAGEALHIGEVTATVEGAFASGVEVVQKILENK